jgi:hypothetical protein
VYHPWVARHRSALTDLEGSQVVVEVPPVPGPSAVREAKAGPRSRVVARPRLVWLEDVSFFPGAVIGRVIAPRDPSVTSKSGWSDVAVTPDGFCRPCTGARLRTAKYALVRSGKIAAFGMRDGDPVRSLAEAENAHAPRDLLVYGPAREAYEGDMGGTNFEIATPQATAAAIHWVLGQHPGAVIIDGSDDWYSPAYVRPEVLCRRYGLRPVALWHTGKSGLTPSGVVLDPGSYEQFRRRYSRQWGFGPERCPGPPPGIGRPPCGCWEGEGLRVYRF